MIRAFQDKLPIFGPRTLIDETALIIGDVTLGNDCFVLPMCILRGDVNSIVIGNRTNIQDHSIIHVNHIGSQYNEASTVTIADDVTIGHRVTLHGCHVKSRCLIGIGSIIMDNTTIESDTIIAAGSLIPSNKTLEGGFLWMGSPAKKIRPLTADEKQSILYSAAQYVKLKNDVK
jgi:carbonic anhydrase/acetyltransferase-like protein (isoleucine patch superfamily)